MKKQAEEVQFEIELAEGSEQAEVQDKLELQAEDESRSDTDDQPSEEDDIPSAEVIDLPAAEKPQTGWRRLFLSEDLPQVSLREILGGDFLVGDFLRRQIGFIMFLVLLSTGYITNRYAAQQEIIEEENLRKELADKRNYALTQYCELTQQSRQSMLEQRLRANGDTTLTIPKEPPYFIKKK